MIRQLALFLLVILFFPSCAMMEKKQDDYGSLIEGNWLILYPDHDLVNANQRKIYAGIQDSIVGLLGLKTISFHNDGSFVQTDSVHQAPGKWHFNAESKSLFIRDAGKGLEFFQGKFTRINNDTMQVIEMIKAGGEQIKLTWFLKRISDKKRLTLFSKAGNWWRKRDSAKQTEQLTEKIKAILDYYSLYYEMVSMESAYFSQSRVFLPFRYYQHSIALKSFEANSQFSKMFFNEQQARQAHGILSEAMDEIRYEPFPSGKDFVIEYSRFLKNLADAIEK